MEKRKRLSDIGRQTRIKVQKQGTDVLKSYCDGDKPIGDEVDFVATSLNKTGHCINTRSNANDIKTGQESGLFTNAVIRVDTSKQLITSSTLSVHDQSDVTRTVEMFTNDCLPKADTQTGKTYVRDDSGYNSDDFSETLSNSEEADDFEQGEEPKVVASIENIKQVLKDEENHQNPIAVALKESEYDSVNKDVVVDESDEILTSECIDIINEKVPNSVDKRWARNSVDSGIGKYLYKNGCLKRSRSLPESLRRDKYIDPDHKSVIYIQHEYADTKFGDEFGAELWTYNTKQADGTIYKQHYFVLVKQGAPAAKMKIESYDEVVLLNGGFVPDLEHSTVIDLFKNVKVDGKTRFKLVLRRLVDGRSKKEWEWLETSAILSPDIAHDLDKYPEVRKEKCRVVRSNQIVTKTVHYFKTTTKAQHYLDVQKDTVKADVMYGTDEDKSKRIWKTVYYTILNGFPPNIDRKATLYCEVNSKYIVIDHGSEIKLSEHPMRFDIDEMGNDITFKNDGRYLSCNNKNCKIEPSDSEYRFTQFPADKGEDQVDFSLQTTLSNDTSSCCARAMNASITSVPEDGWDNHYAGSNDRKLTRSQHSMEMEMETETSGSCTRRTTLTLTTSDCGSASRSRSGRTSADILKTPTTPLKYLCI